MDRSWDTAPLRLYWRQMTAYYLIFFFSCFVFRLAPRMCCHGGVEGYGRHIHFDRLGSSWNWAFQEAGMTSPLPDVCAWSSGLSSTDAGQGYQGVRKCPRACFRDTGTAN